MTTQYTYGIDDIDKETARNAFLTNRMDAEKWGEITRNAYVSYLDDFTASLPESDASPELFEKFKAGLLKRYQAYLSANSRCASSFVVGGGNFNVRQAHKRNEILHSREGEIYAWVEKGKEKIRLLLNPDIRPIMSGDADAVERLEAKIINRKKELEDSKQWNKYVQSWSKKGSLHDFVGFREYLTQVKADESHLCYLDSVEIDKVTYTYLVNIRADIKRLEGRLIQVKRAKDAKELKLDGIDGIRIEQCPSENRIKIFFVGKPDSETRAQLKLHGYRWAPSEGAWKAYINSRAVKCARTFLPKKETTTN